MRLFKKFKHVSMSAFLSLIMLFSFATHSHDTSTDLQVFEQLDCKLCQQKADPAYRPVTIANTNIGQYSAPCLNKHVMLAALPTYVKPSQRAPPTP
ncbi:hypothetical protein Q4489_04780 [Thalassotalea sp. 1_MG-2023]|uniref:hypothetical protein n=1 Tax=Thalassotalea sp. 1_MG-2023 TaxID=3062680 RepID=UPI0026E3706F|nr:hypothetical protein [Thalassotalea sp. 1_MG-2023]MDO6426314.1 hypothetical protein [Thalassotalea sp. 1_MG-2023]